MPTPSVYAYLDYRTFLRDWIDARRRVEPDYSYARFAKAAGCSKSAIANVLGGSRHPQPPTLDAFAQGMELRGSERHYLGLLVDLAKAPDLSTRTQIMGRILAIERFQQMRLAESGDDSDLGRYLSRWYLPVIREMATLPGCRADPTWIAEQLRPAITPEQAAAAVDELRALDLVVDRDDGTLEALQLRFRTEPEAHQDPVGHYHRDVVPTLLAQLDTSNAQEQHLVGVTLALPMELLPEAKARVNRLVDQLAGLADAPDASATRRVFQVCVQVLPVTAPLDES